MRKSTQGATQIAVPWIRFSKIVAVSILCLLVPVMVQGEEGDNKIAVLPF